MHRLSQMIDANCFNEYVDPRIIDIVRADAAIFNANPTYKNRIKLISDCPQGIELFMRVSTNYLQLRTIYSQRHNHRLVED